MRLRCHRRHREAIQLPWCVRARSTQCRDRDVWWRRLRHPVRRRLPAGWPVPPLTGVQRAREAVTEKGGATKVATAAVAHHKQRLRRRRRHALSASCKECEGSLQCVCVPLHSSAPLRCISLPVVRIARNVWKLWRRRAAVCGQYAQWYPWQAAASASGPCKEDARLSDAVRFTSQLRDTVHNKRMHRLTGRHTSSSAAGSHESPA